MVSTKANSKTKSGEVTISGLTKGKVTANVSIPKTIKVNGYTYKVTAIAKNAYKNQKNIKSITIGSNVKTIGKDAFKGCKNLKKVTINSTKLTDKNVSDKLFAGVKKCTVYVPKSKLAAYKKIFAKTAGKKVLTFKVIK